MNLQNFDFLRAWKKTLPVLAGYLAIGAAYGLLVQGAGYPFWFAPLSCVLMYTGAGQYAAVGLFVRGAGLSEMLVVQLALAARHIAYGFTMYSRYKNTGAARPYLVYALTDETFALLATSGAKQDTRFMLCVSALDQNYWVIGSFLGAAAGSLLPFNTEGVTFAITALFIVLALEQFIPLAQKLRALRHS